MTKKANALWIAGLLLVLATVVVVCFRAWPLEGGLDDGAEIEQLSSGDAGERTERDEGGESGSQLSERRKQLQELKKRWLAVQSESATDEQRDKLAEESVDALLCSDEMVELIEFLEGRKISMGSNHLGGLVWNLFSSPLAATAREMLPAICDDNRSPMLKRGWVGIAGKYCPESEFKEFHAALAKVNPYYAHLAAFAHFDERAKAEPEAAVELILQELAKKPVEIDPNFTFQAYLDQGMKELPAFTDFAKVEELLYRYHPDGEMMETARFELFRNWAVVNPTDAVNHILAHSERLDPVFVNHVIEVNMDGRDPEAAFEWIQGFPSEIRDQALLGALDSLLLNGPQREQAKKFAAAIGDAELRRQMTEHAESFNPPNDSDDDVE